jgi:Zn-dependent M28 family amino/carboxypeptidase
MRTLFLFRLLVSRKAFAWILLAAAGMCIAGCAKRPSPPDAGLNAFNGDVLMNHIRKLASDEFEGRAPGSKGEDLSVQYLEQEFRKLNLQPGNPDGTFVQKVPLVEITPDAAKMKLSFSAKGRAFTPKYRQDYVTWTKRVVETAAMEGDLIFVGYGVQAPEFQWDDFKGADLKGKVLVVLINDPPLEDEKMFGGKAMTYYGRWTYKYEKAAELGAAGCFIVHETGPAGYPWEVVSGSWGRGQFDLSTPDKNMGRVAVEGWLTWDQAEKLFKAAGKDLAALKKEAVTREFKPVPLGIRAKAEITNALRTVDSRNVIAKLPGSDESLKNEYVIYTAHWDHFGIGPEVNGDKIYNGALDNATGTAGLLEVARAYTALEVPPQRSILFLSVTAEEQGLLGSRYYAEHPLYPLANTAAVINMDGLNMLGKTRDIVSIGQGSSTLDAVIEWAAAEQKRVVKPDPEPEKGFFYRSDHFPFAKAGVPAFNPNEGVDYVGRPEGWGLEQRKKYTAEDYHKPSDHVKPDWVTDGAIEDLQLFFRVGYRVATTPQAPEWKPGAEFRAIREESLRKAGKR